MITRFAALPALLLVTLAISTPLSGCGAKTASLLAGLIPVIPEPVPTNCPGAYVEVPALLPYASETFCIAKYEMKSGTGGAPISEAAGAPWVSLSRDDAIAACQSLGSRYDLVTNDQWQAIARNVAGTATNWSAGAIPSTEVNRGHTDGTPGSSLAASTDDNDGCLGTGQTCSATVWSDQRRTHVLSTGAVLWDLAGNVVEWTKNASTVAQGANAWSATVTAGGAQQADFGPNSATVCASPGVAPYCGLGYTWTNYTLGAITRGGRWDYGRYGGVFTGSLNTNGAANISTGFRCTFRLR